MTTASCLLAPLRCLAAVLLLGTFSLTAAIPAELGEADAPCRTVAGEIARIGAMPGHTVLPALDMTRRARAMAWLASQGAEVADASDISVFHRADGVLVLAIATGGCVTRWTLIPPLLVDSFVTAVEGTSI